MGNGLIVHTDFHNAIIKVHIHLCIFLTNKLTN